MLCQVLLLEVMFIFTKLSVRAEPTVPFQPAEMLRHVSGCTGLAKAESR